MSLVSIDRARHPRPVVLDGDAERALTWVAIILIVLCAFWLVLRYMKWATTNFVITSDRYPRSGVLAKSGIDASTTCCSTSQSSNACSVQATC